MNCNTELRKVFRAYIKRIYKDKWLDYISALVHAFTQTEKKHKIFL